MTVAIAAACVHNTKRIIVLCHDWQGSFASVGSSESFDKQRMLGKNWVALISGNISQAEELCAILDGAFGEGKLNQKDALAVVRKGVYAYKKQLIEQHLRGTYGIEFDTLRNKGKDIYPPTLLQQIHREIADLSLGVDLIITGFVEMIDYVGTETFLYPCIIQVSASGNQLLDISIQDSFACVGEGAASASASLLFRAHSDDWKLTKTVYAVYEAKTLAEILPSVGGATSIYIQFEDEPLKYINSAGFKKCEDLFDVFGPKKIAAKALRESGLSADDFEWDDAIPRRRKARPDNPPTPSLPPGDPQPT
jgi:hypothetical protein